MSSFCHLRGSSLSPHASPFTYVNHFNEEHICHHFMTSSVDTQTRSLAQNKPLMCNYSLKQMTFWSTNARLYLRWSASLDIWFSLNRSGPPCWAANRQPISETCELENSYQRFVYTFCTDHRATEGQLSIAGEYPWIKSTTEVQQKNKTKQHLNWTDAHIPKAENTLKWESRKNRLCK